MNKKELKNNLVNIEITKQNMENDVLKDAFFLKNEVIKLIEYLKKIFFETKNLSTTIDDLEKHLHFLCKYIGIKNPREKVSDILKNLVKIKRLLKGDIEVTFKSDPASKSLEEIILSYPGIKAILIYRTAHLLYLAKIPLIPRIMTEIAHSKTGIDIHPGAIIGKNFFIDHGTGIVIGETSIIKNNVKIYQGVTLGALAPAKGEKNKNKDRHPIIEDDVIIYAEATILGRITIGKGSIIGGNVWLRNSIKPNSLVINSPSKLIIKKIT